MSIKYEELSEEFPEEGFSENEFLEESEEFSELIKYTIPGYILGFLQGFSGFPGISAEPCRGSGLSGLCRRGESIFEGIFPSASASGRLKEVWQKLMAGENFRDCFSLIIDLGSRLAGVDVYGVEGFYIPYFYASVTRSSQYFRYALPQTY